MWWMFWIAVVVGVLSASRALAWPRALGGFGGRFTAGFLAIGQVLKSSVLLALSCDAKNLGGSMRWGANRTMRTVFMGQCLMSCSSHLSQKIWLVCAGKNGGRDRDRTCDPYDVNVVLSR